MIYGTTPTKALHDRARSPAESFPYVFAIVTDPRHQGAAGRKQLRKVLGPEHELSQLGIPGMRGYPVWRFVLDGNAVHPAPAGYQVDGLPTVYLLGPTAKTFMIIVANEDTSGEDAMIILKAVANTLGVIVPRVA